MAKTQRPARSHDSGSRNVPPLVISKEDAGQPPKVSELDAEERNRIYEAAKQADYRIPELQATPMAELVELAIAAGIPGSAGLNKQELIFEILKSKATSKGLGWGEGTLDILPDGFGFLRSQAHNYRSGPDDIYVSPSQIRRLGLKQGHQISGPVRPPKEGEKYFALLHVETVNGLTIEELKRQINYGDLTPILPFEPLQLEHPDCPIAMRLIDLLTPMGKGQRSLILAPPQSGRTNMLIEIATAILSNHEEPYVFLLLLDERPEEVTDAIRRTGPESRREVIASTFDEPASQHVALAEIVLEKARRLVEAGREVVILVDSLTSLTRAYNTETPHSGKVISAGLDAVALQAPKRLFGSARRLEEGGSLSIIATILTDTGARMNDVICEEFMGKANSEIVLDHHLVNLHIYPAIDIKRSGTRREDNLLSKENLERLRKLRSSLDGLSEEKALEKLVEDLSATKTNADFLAGL